jgi:outer membrane receptor protein involved in Fe transport
MHTHNHCVRRIGAAILGALTLQSGMAQTAPAVAENKTTADGLQVLDAFVTTGSNIKRLDQEKTLPVTVVTTEMIEARDSATPMDLLIGIPQVTDIPSNETSTNAVAARGGNANVALRGIGSANTLVLLNGRRNPMHPFNTSSVNVNTLPTFGVQQVEVLRDGASAIYGSDAVAGVINYVTKKQAEGTEYSLRYGFTEHGGGMDIQGNFGFGKTFAHGKGTWLMGLTAYNRDAIFWREREWSASSDKHLQARPPFNVPGSTYDNTTNVSRWPSFTVAGLSGTRWFFPLDGTPTGTPALTTTALPRSLYADYNAYTTGQPMSARGNIYNRIEYELTPSLRVFGEISGYVSKSQTSRQPITLNSSDSIVVLSANNPYNPYGSRFYSPTGTANADGTARLTGTPAAVTLSTVLMVDGGPEKVTASDTMYRLVGGLGGTFGKSTWSWETAAMLSGVRATDFATNSVRDSYLRAAALRTDATAWNPFGYTFKVQNGAVVADQPYTNPKAVRDYYTVSANRFGHSRMASYDVRANGQVVDYWAGSLSASAGGEWRYESKEDHKDPFVALNSPGIGPDGQPYDVNDNDILVMSPKVPYAASRVIVSAFAEAVAPLVAPKNQLPLMHSLELDASARLEHYSDFGTTTKPKFGVNWKPVRSLMVRASVNQGFRAPDLEDLYRPPSYTVGSPPGTRDTVRNNFLTQTSVGLPADVQILAKTYNLGNSALQPEQSEGRSVGLALDVPKIKGLSFSIDYWEITQNSLITSKGRDTDLDSQLLRAYTQQQLAAGKNINDIDVGYHVSPGDPSTYVGDPYTLRLPVTAADRALFAQANAKLSPANQLAPLGQWVGSISQTVNSTGRNFTNGFDYSMSYSLPRTPLGQFRLNTDWAMFLNKFSKTTPTSQKNDTVIGMVTAKWKGSATLQWRKAAWSAAVNASYSSMVGSGATTTAASYAALNQPDYIRVVYNNAATSYREIGSDQLQLNGSVSYRFSRETKWLRGATVRLGINNLLDATPNLTNAAAGYSGGTGSSLWVGRAYTFTFTRQL